LETCWDHYVKGVIEELDPSYVICIGRGLDRILGDRLRRLLEGRYLAVQQPQARLGSEEQMATFRQFHEICRDHCIV